VFQVGEERFAEMIADALDAIPAELAGHMENVAVFVEDEADSRRLLGLYEGIPLTKRAGYGYGSVMPDKITLYRLTICSYCSTEEEVARQVRSTLIHEVGHHFGIDDARLRALGW
jgi:predicted Zn-dependent protease with MMP-like domain